MTDRARRFIPPPPIYGEYLDPAAAFGTGLYAGAGRLVRQPALIANQLGQELGLRSPQEAAIAAQQIEQTLATPPFISPETEANLGELSDRYRSHHDAGQMIGGVVGTKGLLRAALGKNKAADANKKHGFGKQLNKQVQKRLAKAAKKRVARRALKKAKTEAVHYGTSTAVKGFTDIGEEPLVIPDKMHDRL